MAKFKLKNYHGEDVEYDTERVLFNPVEGEEKVPFSYGITVENVPISLDFSAGKNHQTVTADEGYLVKSAVIEKPVDLVAENIAKGVTIAGIEGTHEGGGGATQEIVQVTGEYTPTESGIVTVEHNLGVIPDIIMVRANAAAGGYIANITGFAEEIAQDGDFQKIQVNSSNGLISMDGKINIFSDSDSNGMIHSATPKIFKVGGSFLVHEVGKTYSWTVIGGLVHRQGYFFMRLALDGNGNLIVTGGVPAIQQLKIYVDGTLAKTVDYAHADEVTIDISDVAGEFQEYTITVEGVGENLNSQYPYSFYDTVTGYTVSLGGSCGASAYWRLTGDGTLTIYGEGAMDDYAAVTDQPWYNHAAEIKEVTIKNGIVNIGDYAFRELTNLSKITIPDGVTTIGANSLRSTALVTVTFPESVTTLRRSIFSSCSKLTAVNIPYGISRIETYTFSDCINLTRIDIPDSVTSIGAYAFYKCTSLTSITIPAGVTRIENSAIRGCSSLATINILGAITYIGEYALADSIITSFVIPDTVTEIVNGAFYACTKLTSVTIGSGVKSIGATAFTNCSNLTSAYFKVTSGWKRYSSATSTSGTTISSSYLSSTSAAATYLRSTYAGYYWKRT